ncbi:MAG: hypothetical protein HQL32_02825 [Planctomycetes bacterium]|nr:hypothetical protein [Planctomycetota bacterium]
MKLKNCPFCATEYPANARNAEKKWQSCSCGGAVLGLQLDSLEGKRISCPKCKKKHGLSDKLIAKKLKCSCGFRFMINNASQAAKKATPKQTKQVAQQASPKQAKQAAQQAPPKQATQQASPKQAKQATQQAPPKQAKQAIKKAPQRKAAGAQPKRQRREDPKPLEQASAKKNPTLVIASICALALLALGIGGYVYVNSQNEHEDAALDEATTASGVEAPKESLAATSTRDVDAAETNQSSALAASSGTAMSTDTDTSHSVAISPEADANHSSITDSSLSTAIKANNSVEASRSNSASAPSKSQAPPTKPVIELNHLISPIQHQNDKQLTTLVSWEGDYVAKDTHFAKPHRFNDGRLNSNTSRSPEKGYAGSCQSFVSEATAPEAHFIRAQVKNNGKDDSIFVYTVNKAPHPLSYLVLWNNNQFLTEAPCTPGLMEARLASKGKECSGVMRWVVLANDKEYYISEPKAIDDIGPGIAKTVKQYVNKAKWYFYDPETQLDKIDSAEVKLPAGRILGAGLYIHYDALSLGAPRKENGLHIQAYKIQGKVQYPSKWAARQWSCDLDEVDLLSTADMCGMVAMADSASARIELRNIREEVVAKLSKADFATGQSASVENASIQAMTFSQSARLLFVSLGSKASSGSQVYRYNCNTQKMNLFASKHLLGKINPSAMIHYKGVLYIAGEKGDIIRLKAEMNDLQGKALKKITSPPIISMSADYDAGILYAASRDALYELELQEGKVRKFYECQEPILSVSYSPVAVMPGYRGLYMASVQGGQTLVSLLPKSSSGFTKAVPLLKSTETLKDFSSTGWGAILGVGSRMIHISSLEDPRLTFEQWVEDEIRQHILLAKNCISPALDVASGWVADGVGLRESRVPKGGSVDAAAWVIITMLMSDALFQDEEAEKLVEEILIRQAGEHPDGISPYQTPDGFVVHWPNPKNGMSNDMSCFTIMKINAAAIRSMNYYHDNPEIVRLCKKILRSFINTGDYMNGRGMVNFGSQDNGPLHWGLLASPEIESYLFAEQVGAASPYRAATYDEYYHERSAMVYNPRPLKNEPIVHPRHPSFLPAYGFALMKYRRENEDWESFNNNIYSSYSAWTDDNAPRYITAFSAGPGTEGGYSVDCILRHPGNIVHFPALEGFSSLGNPVPASAAYYAYRDGRRLRSLAGPGRRGANLLSRYSNEKPEWIPGGGGLPDLTFGGLGLMVLYNPEVYEKVVAFDTYMQKPREAQANGQKLIHYSHMTPKLISVETSAGEQLNLGYHYSPFALPEEFKSARYSVGSSPHSPIQVLNPSFDSTGLGAWLPSSQKIVIRSKEKGLVGPCAYLPISSSQSKNFICQAIEVSGCLDGTELYGECLVKKEGTSRQKASMSIVWAKDRSLGSGVLEKVAGAPLAEGKSIGNVWVRSRKPAGARYAILVIESTQSGSDKGGLLVDEVSLRDEGQIVPIEDLSAQKLKKMGPVKGVKSLSETLDISEDPLGTRYIVSVQVESLGLDNAQGHLMLKSKYTPVKAKSYRSRNDPRKPTDVTIQGDILKKANSQKHLFASIRRISADMTDFTIHLNLDPIPKRKISTPVAVSWDNLKVIKVSPSAAWGKK